MEHKIIKEGTCTSLNGKSTLGYQFGRTEELEIVIRIFSNTGGGIYSKKWLAVKELLNVIEDTKSPFSCTVLYPLFRGKSVNTPCFLLAALKKEGFVNSVEDGGYERTKKQVNEMVKPRGAKK